MRWRWIIFALLRPLLLVVISYFVFEFSLGDEQGYKDFCGEAEVVQDSFRQFFKTKKDYPAYSMEQLQRMGGFENEVPPGYCVHYTPFSSTTPDNKIVLRMGLSPFGIFRGQNMS